MAPRFGLPGVGVWPGNSEGITGPRDLRPERLGRQEVVHVDDVAAQLSDPHQWLLPVVAPAWAGGVEMSPALVGISPTACRGF